MHILAAAGQNRRRRNCRQKTSERGKRQAAQDNACCVRLVVSAEVPAFHSKAGCFPIREPALKPADGKAVALQNPHRVKRQGAVRPAAIGDDLASFRQFGKASFEFRNRNIDRTGKMTRQKFVLRPHIQQRDVPAPQSAAAALRARSPRARSGSVEAYRRRGRGSASGDPRSAYRRRAESRPMTWAGAQPTKHALAIPPGLDKAGAGATAADAATRWRCSGRRAQQDAPPSARPGRYARAGAGAGGSQACGQARQIPRRYGS